jgi:hypothetical protein
VWNYNEELKMLVGSKADGQQFKYVLGQMKKNHVQPTVETYCHLFQRSVDQGLLE